MEVIRERSERRRKVITEAAEWASQLPFEATAILIGSYAKGDFNLWSDIDILLIADLTDNPVGRLKCIDTPSGYQVIPLREEEFWRLPEKRSSMAVEAVKHGIILRDGFNVAKRLNVSSDITQS